MPRERRNYQTYSKLGNWCCSRFKLFCPFTRKKKRGKGSVHYIVAEGDSVDEHLEILLTAFSPIGSTRWDWNYPDHFPLIVTQILTNTWIFVNAAEDELCKLGMKDLPGCKLSSWISFFRFFPDDAAKLHESFTLSHAAFAERKVLAVVIDAHPMTTAFLNEIFIWQDRKDCIPCKC